MSRGNEISENRYRVLNIREERVKQSRKRKEKKSMIQTYLENKWNWVDRNPRTAAWIGWFKGLLTGFILWYIIF